MNEERTNTLGDHQMTGKTSTGGNSVHATQTRNSHLFLVRVWAEEDGDGQAEWCGKVQHVLSGKAGHFARLDGMADLVASLMPEDGAEQIEISAEKVTPASRSDD